MTEPLIINKFDQIADSPHQGFGLLKNVEVDAFPGSVRVGRAPASIFHIAFSQTFTADAGTDICTIGSTNVPSTGVAVTVSSTGTLPAGLSASTQYFIIQSSTSTFKLATTIALAEAGTAVDITDAGTGTHTVSLTTPGTIKHYVRDQRIGFVYAIDSNGRVWWSNSGATYQLLSGNTRTNGEGNGLAILLNSDSSATYLFVFRNATIDVINVFGSANVKTPVWSTAWNALNSGAGSGNSHHTIYAQDAVIYFVDSRYIGSIREVAGQVFDPSNSATYAYTNQALDTPQSEVLYWLEELGTNLLASGSTFNKIYPWDRVSDSFNLPLPVPEINVNKMKNIGNLVYILAGTKGNIYRTQGSYVTLFKSLPEYLTNNAGTIMSNPVTWGGIGLKNSGLLFGIGTQTTGTSGVYLLYPDGRLIMDNMPSTGSANVTALFTYSDLYEMGYANGGDSMTAGTRYTNFGAVIQSALYLVGTKTEKATYSTIEVQIAKPVSGASIRLKYRTDISSSFSDFPGGAVSFGTDGVVTSFEQDIGLIDIENVQVQAEMQGNLELVEIRLIP